MEEKTFYNDQFVKTGILYIVRQMYKDSYKPDYIVGITRGGLIPGIMLSYYLDIPFHALGHDESNTWMAEDAFDGKNILIIDDINDTGTTFETIANDWKSTCFPDDIKWNNIWHESVKFASLIENQGTRFNSDFAGLEIDPEENPEYCMFPWENWW